MNMRFLAVAAALSSLPIAAAPAFAQAMTPADYVMTAGASDLYERQSAQAVLETTTDPKVKSFATMMLDAHAKSTADVKAAAALSKVKTPPPMLMPAQTEMMAQLRAETGTARDATYIAQQRAAHGQALNVQQAYASGGTAPALKAAAAKIVPVVEHHIMLLKAM
jgi:putative membrane protein